MAAQKPRNRIVVFRLSQDELLALKAACAANGGHNLSEFTRSELLRLLHSHGSEELLRRGFADVDRKLSDLQAALDQVAALLGGARSPAENDN
jgi:hypothetical protein